jgi:hypothetical protein
MKQKRMFLTAVQILAPGDPFIRAIREMHEFAAQA